MKINDLKNKIFAILQDDNVTAEEGYYAISDIYQRVCEQYRKELEELANIKQEQTETMPQALIQGLIGQEAEIVEEKEEEKE